MCVQGRSLSPVRSVASVSQPRARCRRTYASTSKENVGDRGHFKLHLIVFQSPFNPKKTSFKENTSHWSLSFLRGEKPYDCSVCHKSFSDPSARRRHVTSHSGKKPFTCSFCSLSFTRLDNLKTHIKSHNKEIAAASEAQPHSAETAPEELRNVLQLQQFQLPPGSEQEIQLVVTGDVENINFVPTQEQEISIITTTEGEAAESSHSRLTLLTQSSGSVALVAQGGVVEQSPHIQTINMLEGPMSHQPEEMHVITLSKEAMEHLQVHPGHQVAQRPMQQLQVMQQAAEPDGSQGPAGREKHSQAIHISSQSSQPISISQTSEQISSHHIQGQMFQIQAGTVSYLYTTGLQQES